MRGLVQRLATRTMAVNQQLAWKAECDPDEQVVGGGVSTTRPDGLTIVRSFPDRFDWSVEIRTTSGATVVVPAWALCVPA